MKTAAALLAVLLALALTSSLLLAEASPLLSNSSVPKRPHNFTFFLHNTIFNSTLNNKYFNSAFSVQPTGFPNPWAFGVLATFEDPLTVTASNTSTQLGVGQGFYLYDSQKGSVLFQAFTATIDTGEYTGTIDLFGQIVEALSKRTLTVIGGTGDFFLARGLATIQLIELYNGPGPARWTLSFDLELYY